MCSVFHQQSHKPLLLYIDIKEEIKEQSRNLSVINDLKEQVRPQSYQIEKMEQYRRRDSVRIKRLKYENGEDTNILVMQLANTIGVNVVKEDNVGV